jgi:hypothetical protein
MVRICENCGKEHDGSYGSGRFCCKECARSFSSKNNKGKLKIGKCIICGKEIYIDKRSSLKTCMCDDCKKERECILFRKKCSECYFGQNKICVKKSLKSKLNTLIKYCGFNKECCKKYDDCLKEYFRIKSNIQCLLDNGISMMDICLNEFGSYTHGVTIFKDILQCKTLNLSESIKQAYLNGKINLNYYTTYFKSGWHDTWDGKHVYLRSSYEKEYAEQLDELHIKYEVEYLRIKYLNSKYGDYHCAIPDFYIPSTNTIVEIKSIYTLDIQEMKDKVKAYKELGYNFKLILDHIDQTQLIEDA